MIDPKGKPYDIAVVNSSSDTGLAKRAVEGVERWEYQPAMLNGEPIDAGMAILIKFALKGGKAGAGRSFVSRHRRFQKHIKKNDQTGAASELAKLEQMNRNLHEEAYFHLARYNYHQNWDPDPIKMYRSLTRAATMDRGRGFLPDDLLTKLLLVKLSLELDQNRLADAASTVRDLRERELTADQMVQIDGVHAQIDLIKQSNQSFVTKGVIRDDNQGFQRLMHDRFQLRFSEGDIAELHIHCDRGYVGFVYKPDTVFTVRDDWRDYALLMIGTPETADTLEQGDF